MKKLNKILSLTLVLVLILAGCGAAETGPAQAAVATLDKYAVSQDVYTYFYSMYRGSLEQQSIWMGFSLDSPADVAEYWNMDLGGSTLLEYLQTEALAYAKEHAVLHQEALDSGVAVPEETAASTTQTLEAALAEFDGDHAAFEAAYGIPYDLIVKLYNEFDLIDAYQQKVLDEVTLTEEEIAAGLSASGDMEQVTVRHVLISTTDTDEAGYAAAKAQAEEILQMIQDGADIGTLAAEYSEDPGSSTNNGEYTFGRGAMVAEFESWAYAAEPGDQGIVETTYGFHVMELIARIPAQPEDVRAQLEESLRYEKANAYLAELFAALEEKEWTINEELLATLNDSLSPLAGIDFDAAAQTTPASEDAEETGEEAAGDEQPTEEAAAEETEEAAQTEETTESAAAEETEAETEADEPADATEAEESEAA